LAQEVSLRRSVAGRMRNMFSHITDDSTVPQCWCGIQESLLYAIINIEALPLLKTEEQAQRTRQICQELNLIKLNFFFVLNVPVSIFELFNS
jgi:hypothetical protein